MTESRDAMVDYLHRELIGPRSGEAELLRETPSQRYLMATLYPRGTDVGTETEGDIEDEQGGQIGEDVRDDPIALSNSHMPSSVGLSFLVAGTDRLRVAVRAACYEKEGGGWRRRQLGSAAGHEVEIEGSGGGRSPSISVLEERATVETVFRPFGGGFLVTVALVNRAVQPDRHVGADQAKCLFQIALVCRPSGGEIAPYPTPDRIHIDAEDEELALLYRHQPTWAVGHGCSATWNGSGKQRPEAVAASWMPSETVPQVVFDIDPASSVDAFDQIRSLRFLASIDQSPEEVLSGLRRFVGAYATWIGSLEAANPDVPERLVAAKDRLVRRLRSACARMDAGVEILDREPEARRAFALANRAMLMQMRHVSAEYAGRRAGRNEHPFVEPDYGNDRGERWRPFQLGFALLVLESVFNGDSADRGLVDLIWFPTGGGKTEAYLLLAAFQIFLRRLRLGDLGAGTSVITRYTLRLLTSQQFQRAATMVCACELLRAETAGELGTTPVTIGIWVGGDTSPNSYAQAIELKQGLLDGEMPAVSFQLELCPWCGTEIVPEDRADDEAWGVHPRNDACVFNCPSDNCPFHARLPIQVVDEGLYEEPPTVLIATVDKFARMPWDQRPGVFLGSGGYPGPSLIIQDELHLISGPLGTIAGLYEAAFDQVMRGSGNSPKIIASTATIRRADRQVRSLFGRSVSMFPPSGLTADSSYFVRVDRTQPGRRYVGIMAQSHTPTTAMVHTAAVLLQGPVELGFSGDDLDHFWTLVAYHNSLRELGKTVTLARDDIPARISVIASAEDQERTLSSEGLIELTSNIPAAQIPRNLELLTRSQGDPECIDFVACTNMISAGVDVGRLGLMLVAGQPKSTSEYIQATSRIGRQFPGLVVTLYSAAKPRDRSHYESFRSYHAALYRQVEASSVTPFSLPARERALHAALVTIARHGLGLGENDDARAFDSHNPVVERLVNDLLARVAISDPDEREETAIHLNRLLQEWEDLKVKGAGTGGLRYVAPGKAQVGLLKRFGIVGTGWTTLDSMRNIDRETLIKVRGES